MDGFYSMNPTMILAGTMEEAVHTAERLRIDSGIEAFGMVWGPNGGWRLFYWGTPKTESVWKETLAKPKGWWKKLWKK